MIYGGQISLEKLLSLSKVKIDVANISCMTGKMRVLLYSASTIKRRWYCIIGLRPYLPLTHTHHINYDSENRKGVNMAIEFG